MDNKYNYGNNEEKREEPARIEPPVPEDGIIEEAAQTEQRTEQENTSYYEKPPVYESSTQESRTQESQTRESQSYESQAYGAPTYEQPDEQSKKQTRRHMRKKKERKPIHIGVKWAICICMALVFGLLASAAFQASNVVINKVVGNKTTVASSGQKVNSTKVSTNTSSDVDSELADMVENVMPSVVSITNLSVQQVQDFFGGVREYESQSSGSGIIIGQNDSELLIVTNNHVVEGSSTLTVTFVDEESVEAQVKGTNSNIDLAVVAVPLSSISSDTMSKISVATIGDSSKLEVGEQVVAIGNALGYGQSVTTGIVSATNRTLDSEDSCEASYDGISLIQTDAAINPGNSGGALLNMNGEVIGINSAKLASTEVEGMGYAIPISRVSDIIDNLMNQTTRTKVDSDKQGTIGIKGINVTSDVQEKYNLPEGIYVSEVTSGSAAEKAGITSGSVITKFDGKSVTDIESLQDLLQYYKAGETVELTLQVPDSDSYKEKTVSISLGSKSDISSDGNSQTNGNGNSNDRQQGGSYSPASAFSIR
mgnify:CR=1 FL=1